VLDRCRGSKGHLRRLRGDRPRRVQVDRRGQDLDEASAGLADQGGTQEGGQLVIDPNAPRTLYVAAWDGVYKSGDGGGSWKMILSAGYLGEGNRLCSVVLAPSATPTLYAWTSDGLFRSDDGGNKWTALTGKGLVPKDKSPFQGQLALVAADDPDTLFAVKDYDMYRSTDGGKTWTMVLPHTGASFDGYTMDADPNNRQRCTRTPGPYKVRAADTSTPWSNPWTKARRGPPSCRAK